jgi:hypothetical protein
MVLFEPPPQREECEDHFSARPLSAVGSIVSWSVASDWSCSFAAHPGAARHFVARDLDKIARGARSDTASLFQLFDRSEVERALALDPYLRKFKDAGDFGPCEFTLLGYETEWALYDLLPKGEAAVRLGLGHGCEVMRGNLTVIGLILHPKPEVAPSIERAARDRLLMRYLAPNGADPDSEGSP